MAQDQNVNVLPPESRGAGAAPMLASAAARAAALAPIAKAKPRRSIRSLILPLIILAAVGYGGVRAYDWFVNGRFLVSTDDAYVGADTAVIAAKVAGHVRWSRSRTICGSTPATCW